MKRNLSFLAILKKNFKLLLRSKSSAVIIILGPLLIVLLIGFAFSNSESQLSLSVGVYSEDYSELTESIVDKLADKFTVYQFESISGCVKYVRRGKTHLCIFFPPDMDVRGNSNEITFYVDYSRINVVWMILDVITEKISSESADISTQLTDILLKKLEMAQNESESDRIIVSAMIGNNEKLDGKISGLYSELGDLDLDTADFDIDQFRSTTDHISQLCKDAANISMDIITGVEDAMHDANCTDTDPIEEVIEPVEDEIIRISNAIEMTMSENGSFQRDLQTVISAAESTEKKLDKAEEIRDEAVRDNTVEKAISNNSVSLAALQSSLEKIDTEITTLEIKDSARIVNPITTKIEPVTLEVKYFNYLFPTLIILIVMITSILLASTLVMNEKKSTSFFRNVISPVSAFWFNLGTFLTTFIIIVCQVLVFLIVALVFTNIHFLSGIPAAALALIFIISTFVLFGMLIGYWFKSEETTTLAAISFSCIFLFFSNLILPIERMPSTVQFIAQYNPFVVAENLLRQALIFHSGIMIFLEGFIILIAWMALFFIITFILIKLSGKSSFFKQKRRF